MTDTPEERKASYIQQIRNQGKRLREQDPLGVFSTPLEMMAALMEKAYQEGSRSSEADKPSAGRLARELLIQAGSIDRLEGELEKAWPRWREVDGLLWEGVSKPDQEALLWLFPYSWGSHPHLLRARDRPEMQAFGYKDEMTRSGRRRYGYYRLDHERGALSHDTGTGVETVNRLFMAGLLKHHPMHPKGVCLVPTDETVATVKDAYRKVALDAGIPLADHWQDPLVPKFWAAPDNWVDTPPPPFDRPFQPGPSIRERGWQNELPENAAAAVEQIASASVDPTKHVKTDMTALIDMLLRTGRADAAQEVLGRNLPEVAYSRVRTAFRTQAIAAAVPDPKIMVLWLPVNGMQEAEIMAKALQGHNGGQFLRATLGGGDKSEVTAIYAPLSVREAMHMPHAAWECAFKALLQFTGGGDVAHPTLEDPVFADWCILPVRVTRDSVEAYRERDMEHNFPGAPAMVRQVYRPRWQGSPAHHELFNTRDLPLPERRLRLVIEDAFLDVAIGLLDAHRKTESQRIMRADPQPGTPKRTWAFTEMSWNAENKALVVADVLRTAVANGTPHRTMVDRLLPSVELPVGLIEGRWRQFMSLIKHRTSGGGFSGELPPTYREGNSKKWGQSKHPVDLEALRAQEETLSGIMAPGMK